MTFCFILKLKITLYFIFSHLFSFVLPLLVIPCHSLSFLSLVVIRCHSLPSVVIRCHSLYHSLSFVVYHSLSFAVIRCHSLYQTLPTVVTRCTTRLSFYKRSPKTWNLRYFIEKNHEIWHVSSNMVLL